MGGRDTYDVGLAKIAENARLASAVDKSDGLSFI